MVIQDELLKLVKDWQEYGMMHDYRKKEENSLLLNDLVKRTGIKLSEILDIIGEI
jgi:hypothetical protein